MHSETKVNIIIAIVMILVTIGVTFWTIHQSKVIAEDSKKYSENLSIENKKYTDEVYNNLSDKIGILIENTNKSNKLISSLYKSPDNLNLSFYPTDETFSDENCSLPHCFGSNISFKNSTSFLIGITNPENILQKSLNIEIACDKNLFTNIYFTSETFDVVKEYSYPYGNIFKFNYGQISSNELKTFILHSSGESPTPICTIKYFSDSSITHYFGINISSKNESNSYYQF